MKICLLGASLETNNLGVHALTVGLITSIHSQYPDAEIFVFDYGKEKKIYKINLGKICVNVRMCNIRFSKKLFLKNNIAYLLSLSCLLKILPFKKWRNRILNNNECLKVISDVDIIAAISGGDSFSDIYGFERFIYVCLPKILVQSVRNDLVLLPQTIGPFKGMISKIIARNIIKKAGLVYSRDNDWSVKLPADTKRFRFCYDVGFIVSAIKPKQVDTDGLDISSGESFVGINISGLLYMGGYNRHNMFKLNISYREFVCQLIEYIIQEKKVSVLLIPHVYGSKESESDIEASRDIYKKLKHKYVNKLYLLDGIYDQSEIKYIIGSCEFFIGSRMHACIAAVSQSVPAVSISYSKKFVGLMNTIDMGEFVADPINMSRSEILNIIDEAYERRSIIKARLAAKMPDINERVSSLFRDILEFQKETKIQSSHRD